MALLRDVAKAGQFPSDPVILVRVGNAIKAAFNFVRFFDAIQRPAPPGLKESLRRALGGSLDDTGSTDAHRAQSELFVGAALASGLGRLGSPEPGQTVTPDYVAEIDTLRFSNEVKRPESLASIEANVAAAVKQIRDYDHYPGHVALDLTDTLPTRAGVADLDASFAANEAVFRQGYELAREQIRRCKTEPGYSRVAILTCVAESFVWTAGPPVEFDSKVFLYIEVFPDASAGLIVDQSRKLRVAIAHGFKDMGATFNESRTP